MKKLVDDYLGDNLERISEEREKKGFRWSNIANEIGVDVPSEYVRLRHKYLVKKTLRNYNSPIENERQNIFKNVVALGVHNEEHKEFKFTANRIPTYDEIISHFNIDTTKFFINQTYLKTSFGGKFAITVSILAIKGNKTIYLDDIFIKRLNKVINSPNILKSNIKLDKKLLSASLLIPKQDAHWNKYDIYGNNCIEERFEIFISKLTKQLNNIVKINKLEEILYIVGSDEFNSEWTNMTTKGTPQQNILSYKEAFELISEFNIKTIKLLASYSYKVKVMLLNGNHDYNVSWHLAHLLKRIFSNNINIEVDDTLTNTKIYSYGDNLCLLNHGDEMKPRDLANKFPIIAKDKWSNFSNYFCISGDKHHELSHDFNGIVTFQVPQLSKYKSLWDEKKGYVTSKSELITFLFENDGLSSIFRDKI